MSPSVLARGAVFCGLCGSEFSFPHQVERRIPDAMAQAARQEELSQGVVDGSFVARRRLALDHDPSADASGPALAHLARLGAAIDAVAADLPDGRLMQQVFADTRAEIVAWIESRSAEVINLHPHRRGEERRSPVEADVVADLDLRTVELAGSPLEPQLSVTSQPVPVREADPVGPDRSIPEVP